MKILHVDRQRSWTGQVGRQFRVVTGLRARGHDVGVVCHPGARIAARAREAGIETLEFTMRGPAAMASIPNMARALRERRVDVFHAHGPRDHFLGMFAAGLARTPVFLRTKHNHTRLRSGAFSRWQYSRCAHVVAVSDYVRRALVEDGVPAERVTTIPTAIDTERFAPRERDPALARELGLPDGATVVGSVSSLHERKGIDTILHGFARLRAAGDADGVVLLLAGKNRRPWAALARQLGVGDAVFLPGFREDVPEILALLDVYVLPSCQEALGTSVIEAMGAGLPVVVSGVGGIPESVTPESGVLVEPGDPVALADAVRALLADPERRRRMGAAGRARVVERFSVDAMVDATERLYERLVAERARQGAALR